MPSYQLSSEILADPELLKKIPAGVPPPNVKPNYAHPESQGDVLVIVGGVMIGLMTILLIVRIYTKAYIARKASWDDLTIAYATIGSIALYTACCWAIKRGPLGQHMYDLHLNDFLTHDFIIPCSIIACISSSVLWSAKMTFFILYLQIFRPLRWLRYSVYFGIAVCTAFYLSTTVTLIYFSTPRPGETWNEQVISDRTTIQGPYVAMALSCVGLIIDVYLLVLPSIAVSTLQLHFWRKLGLMLMFGTGSIAVASSVVNVYYRYVYNQTMDKTWALLPFILMTLVEIDVGVMTACLPDLARMLRHHLPPWKETRSRLAVLIPSSLFNSKPSSNGNNDSSEGSRRYFRKYWGLSGSRNQCSGARKTWGLPPHSENMGSGLGMRDLLSSRYSEESDVDHWSPREKCVYTETDLERGGPLESVRE